MSGRSGPEPDHPHSPTLAREPVRRLLADLALSLAKTSKDQGLAGCSPAKSMPKAHAGPRK